MESKNSLVVVFPCEPVIPTTFISTKRCRTTSAKVSRAWPTSLTKIDGALTLLDTKANFAPAFIAWLTKSWPSTFSPLNATKNVPGIALLELITGN